MAPEISDPRVPYDFPADVWSLGLVVAALLDQEVCCRWALQQYPQSEQQALLKRWPEGVPRWTMSPRILALQQEMVAHVPGHRPTMARLCGELKKLAAEDPMPQLLWQIPTAEPEGPPPVKAISPKDAAEIAGKGGYGAGVRVQVKVDGGWHVGIVRHISTTLCPGAVQVHFRAGGGPEERAVLICPWQFQELLRPAAPDVREPTPPPFSTMVFPAAGAAALAASHPVAWAPPTAPPATPAAPASGAAALDESFDDGPQPEIFFLPEATPARQAVRGSAPVAKVKCGKDQCLVQ